MSDRKKKEAPPANAETILPSDSTHHGDFSIDESGVEATYQFEDVAGTTDGQGVTGADASHKTVEFGQPQKSSKKPPSGRKKTPRKLIFQCAAGAKRKRQKQSSSCASASGAA